MNTVSTELTLEQVAEKADVSRKTIYNHFSTKEKLMEEIIEPMLEFCIDTTREIDRKDVITRDDIADLCLRIYDRYGLKLKVIYHIRIDRLNDVMRLHEKYVQHFVRLFDRVESFKRSNLKSQQLAQVVFKTFVPMLDIIHPMDNHQELFNKALNGMLAGLE